MFISILFLLHQISRCKSSSGCSFWLLNQQSKHSIQISSPFLLVFFRPLYLAQSDMIQAGAVSLKWALKQHAWASVRYLTDLSIFLTEHQGKPPKIQSLDISNASCKMLPSSLSLENRGIMLDHVAEQKRCDCQAPSSTMECLDKNLADPLQHSQACLVMVAMSVKGLFK